MPDEKNWLRKAVSATVITDIHLNKEKSMLPNNSYITVEKFDR